MIFLKSQKNLTIILILISIFITSFCIITGSKIKKGHNLSVGSISNKKYKATRSIEDTISTQILRDEAYKSVLPIYNRSSSFEDQIYSQIDSFFDELDSLREEIAQKQVLIILDDEYTDDITLEGFDFENVFPFELSNEVLLYILKLDAENYNNLRESLKLSISNIFQKGIKEDAPSSYKDMLVKEQLPNFSSNYNFENFAKEFLIFFAKPNLTFDESSTKKAIQQKQDQIKPIIYLKDQTIVDDGQIITAAQYQLLKELGYIQEIFIDNIWAAFGAILIVFCIFINLIYYIKPKKTLNIQTSKEKLLLFTIFNLCVVFCYLFRDAPLYFLPVLLFTLLTSVLIDYKFAIIFNLLVTTIAYLISDLSLPFFIYFVLTGSNISIFSNLITQRNKVGHMCILVGVFNTIALLGISLFYGTSISNKLLYDSLFSLLNGIFTVLIVVGSLSFWEAFFGVVTISKLLDLTNPNNSVLKRLTLEAPGTYHHSLIVANLAETAAIDIGANPILARVGGYYHDIGKLKCPLYFSENQLGENPHDFLDARSSVEIIKSHISYGIDLAQIYTLPNLIQDMITQHQGNTLIKYFYHKAKNSSDSDFEVLEDDFRYTNKIPQYKEVGLVMLADTVEAAVRSMLSSLKHMDEVEITVRKLIHDKLCDNQLQDSTLTMSEIEIIIKSFMRVFKGMYHERISYPNDIKK